MFSDTEIAAARNRIGLVQLIGRDVALKRSGTWYVGQCPFHDDSSPSFGITGDRWKCFAGCGSGDAIEYVMKQRGLKFHEAIRELLELPETAPQAAAVSRSTKCRSSQSTDIERVHRIIHESEQVASTTAAWLYLWSRGLSTDQPALRAHPGLYVAETNERLPALVAPIKNSDGHVIACQRIWCLPRVELATARDSRAPLQARKKVLGSMGDGAVRLAAAGPALGLAEGVETAIAAAMLFRFPVWAVCGAARLGSVWVPDCVDQLYIFGDRGEVGERMADAAWREHSQQRQCDVVLPDESYVDFGSMLLGREVMA